MEIQALLIKLLEKSKTTADQGLFLQPSSISYAALARANYLKYRQIPQNDQQAVSENHRPHVLARTSLNALFSRIIASAQKQ